jgi:biotin carboxyl carrier protein
MKQRGELIVRQSGEGTELLSPGVGWFSQALPAGRLLVPGDEAGVLRTLNVSVHLIVPAGVGGRVVSDPPQRYDHPVDFETTLYRLEPLGEGFSLSQGPAAAAVSAAGLAVLAPHAGRYYGSPAPGEPPFVTVGSELREGLPLGVLEVMKTFNRITYRPGRGLPARARVTALLVQDGAEVADGQPLIALEAADG